MRRIILLAVTAAFVAAPAMADQRLYRETDDGWFIYIEDRSCAMYADLPSGTMLRFSNRTDENRIYFTAVNEHWGFLRPRLGGNLTLDLDFVDIGRGLGSAGLVIENPDGRLGYTGNSFPTEITLRYLSTGGRLAIRGTFEATPRVLIEGVNLQGSALAVDHLIDCQHQNFPAS